MPSMPTFTAKEDFDFQGLLEEAIEVVETAGASLGKGPNRTTEARSLADSLSKLKQAQAFFAQRLTVRRLRAGDLSANPAIAVGAQDWLKTHRYWLIQVPVTLMPAAGWAFSRLECWVGFSGGGNAKIHDLYPDEVWAQLMAVQTGFRLGLDESLSFKAQLPEPAATPPGPTLPADLQGKIAINADGLLRLDLGPFDYSAERPEIMARGREGSDAFWRLDGKQHVHTSEPQLAVVLRVPKGTGPVDAEGRVIAYHRFDLLGADLADWGGDMREKLRSFFSQGIPLGHAMSTLR